MCAELKDVTKGQIIGWIIPVVIAFLSVLGAWYVNHETRLRQTENELKVITLKNEQAQREIDIMSMDIKDIKTLVISIDKKVDIDEIKWSRNKR